MCVCVCERERVGAGEERRERGPCGRGSALQVRARSENRAGLWHPAGVKGGLTWTGWWGRRRGDTYRGCGPGGVDGKRVWRGGAPQRASPFSLLPLTVFFFGLRTHATTTALGRLLAPPTPWAGFCRTLALAAWGVGRCGGGMGERWAGARSMSGAGHAPQPQPYPRRRVGARRGQGSGGGGRERVQGREMREIFEDLWRKQAEGGR